MVATVIFAALAALATLSPASALFHGSALTRRDGSQHAVTVSCAAGLSLSGCDCPSDNEGHQGVLINMFPGYQCAYPGGACTWSDKDGKLLNGLQTNCPASSPCPSTGCKCPIDKNLHAGVLLNQFKGFQCAYPSGSCLWDNSGALNSTHQSNCPKQVKSCDM